MVVNVKIIGGGQAAKAVSDTQIDRRAVIHSSAEIGPGCTIGPFAIIGPDVRLGPRCEVHAHSVIQGPAVFGAENVVHSFACIGGPPQDLRHRGEVTSLIVGSGNEFREHVTVNRGTARGGGVTSIGDDNFLMAYCHVAHDCSVGNRVVMANQATLAGHVTVEDHVVFGGMVAVGTFLCIGETAMLAAGSMVEREVPPFCIVEGDRARLRAINRVGLDRRDIAGKARKQIKAIFRALKEQGRPTTNILSEFESLDDLTPEATRMLYFIKKAQHGLTR